MSKKVFILIHIFVLIAIILCSCGEKPATETNGSEMYPLNTVVDEINEKNDTVTCVDCDGNLWEFYGVEDWQEGDFATMIMDTCGTATIYDDEIVTIRYNGTVEGLN